MDFLQLFFVALMPILKVLLITAIGTFLAIERFGILRENARKHMNTMVYYLFTPALICSSLAKTLTFKSMVMLWFMPLNVLLIYIIGTALGWLLVKITRVPHHLQGLVMGCCASGNLGSLVFIIVPALCKERSNPFGDVDVCYRNGLAYASLSMALGSTYSWSIVYNIVRIYSSKISNVAKVEESIVNPLPGTETDPEDHSKCSIRALFTAEDKSQPNDRMDQLEVECKVPDEQAQVPEKLKIMKHLKILADKINLRTLFAPSTMGAIIGLTIGVVPQFRKLLVGDSAPLHVFQDSANMIGDASIPSMILLLGANLQGIKGLGMQFPLIIGIIVVKYIALPAIGIGIVKGAVHFSLIHPDPLYQFVLLLQFALPPALVVSTITQLFGVGESECSVIMLATYSCAAVSLTFWCTFFMWLVL
ncbi:protein PIN-LIKES 3-like [Gastrolobium bilobum]|uniref:protein PIN-LIKES 3-like n=1 Tax=Gastrolobium bilobum TaxID=150636 RepID=UPI002AAF8179|nr:protein PIN-LIKES 3-like [Gastrolobium bilobum]